MSGYGFKGHQLTGLAGRKSAPVIVVDCFYLLLGGFLNRLNEFVDLSSRLVNHVDSLLFTYLFVSYKLVQQVIKSGNIMNII